MSARRPRLPLPRITRFLRTRVNGTRTTHTNAPGARGRTTGTLFSGAAQPYPTPGEEYNQAAQHAADAIIRRYSNSFSLATRALAEPVRTHVRNLYAMVRIADELVDGVGAEFQLTPEQTRQTLDDYEAAVYAAVDSGFSTDLIIHAFAITAHTCDFDPEHVRDFFRSMRQDTHVSHHSANSVEDYVHGSAEVIGQMCNSIFSWDATTSSHPWSTREAAIADAGAIALGRAFQKVNFLRDMAVDTQQLGRDYLSADASQAGVLKNEKPTSTAPMDDAAKSRYVAEIRADLAAAREALPLLPLSARAGVASAHDLFEELTRRLDEASVAEILAARISVPPAKKLALTSKAVARTLWEARR